MGQTATTELEPVATARPSAEPDKLADLIDNAQRVWRRRRRRELRLAATFLLPALVVLIGLRLWPLVESIRLSFTDWDGLSSPHWIGFSNYVDLWHDRHFWQSLLVNGKLVLVIPIFVVLPLIIAALLQSRVAGWSFFRSAFFIPTLLSPAVIGLTFKMMLGEDGPVNRVLTAVGLGSWTRVWLTDPHWALIWLMIIAAWAHIGIGVVIFLSAMGTVDPDLIDAARMDGASWLGVQRNVIFWQILPVIEMWTVLLLIGMLTSFFPLILLLTNGGPSYATTTADLYSYQQAFTNYKDGYASAVSVAIFLVTVVFIGLLMIAFDRGRRRTA